MAFLEGESVRVLEKFNGTNFNLWKFKMNLALSSMDLWEIVEGTEEAPPSDASEKDKKEYKRRVKKAMSMIGLNLVDAQLAHIKGCKDPAEAWRVLCNIHETRSLSNILFLRRKFFTSKMEEGADLLEHINNIKALADQLACLEVPMRDDDIVMTLLDSLPPSFEHLITALETLKFADLTIEFVTGRLMHEVNKRKEKGAPSGEAALVAAQYKGRNQNQPRVCYICGKPGHIARYCFKNNKKEKESANVASNKVDEVDYAFLSALVASNDGDDNTMAKWIMDSGATKHMTSHRAAFQTYEVISPPLHVHLGDDSIVHAVGIGTIVEEVVVMGVKHKINMKDVLHIPKFKKNLICVVRLALNGLKVEFDDDACIVRAANRKVIVRLPREGSLYEMPFSIHDLANVAHQMPQSAPLELWHRRLGHLNVKSVKALQSMVNGMQIKDATSNSTICEGCIEGKFTRTPFPNEGGQRASKPLELVHSDVCGPFKTISMGGCLYFVTFIDDFSRKVWIYVLESKAEVFAKFVEFKALVETQSEHKIKAFRSDNGGEFTSKAFESFFHSHGIERQLSTPYTPQQNGVAERANRTIVEMARSMLHHQNLNKNLWADAVVTAVYTRNRCPTSALKSMTPEEPWSRKRPSITHMCVFGCIAYAKVPDAKRTKLDTKGTKCLFLGYCEGTKAYRLMCLETKKIIKCRDVVFAEDATCDDANVEMHPSGSLEPPTMILVDAPQISAPLAQGALEPLEAQEEE